MTWRFDIASSPHDCSNCGTPTYGVWKDEAGFYAVRRVEYYCNQCSRRFRLMLELSE